MFEENRTKQLLNLKRTCRQQHPYFKIVNYTYSCRSLSYQSPAVFFKKKKNSAIDESLIKAVVVSAKGKV